MIYSIGWFVCVICGSAGALAALIGLFMTISELALSANKLLFELLGVFPAWREWLELSRWSTRFLESHPKDWAAWSEKEQPSANLTFPPIKLPT